MDELLVATLFALSLGVGAACWYALAKPEILLSLWERMGDPWLDEEAASLRALRWSLCALVVVLAFLGGFAMVFLSSV